MFTFFQIMTFESWAMGIVRPVMEIYPWAWVLFVAFLLLSSFTVLNLFIAIIIDAMQAQGQKESSAEGDELNSMFRNFHTQSQNIEKLRDELRELKQLIAIKVICRNCREDHRGAI